MAGAYLSGQAGPSAGGAYRMLRPRTEADVPTVLAHLMIGPVTSGGPTSSVS